VNKRYDLTGQRFGKQVVTKELGNGLVEIQCDCGVIKTTPKQYLRNGQSRSCGCGRYAIREGTQPIVVGDVFDRLTVVQFLGSNGHKREVLCLCSCGLRKVVFDSDLRTGHVTSCGCFRRERTGNLQRKHGQGGTKRTSLYRAWESMHRRCNDATRYPSYGGRGIRVCDEWKSFEAFRDHMDKVVGPRPDHGSLDRIDNDGNYEPGNVRWADPKIQTRNRSSARFFTLDGVTRCLVEWAELADVSSSVILARIRHGWNLRDALTTPKQKPLPPRLRAKKPSPDPR
jgi:hypothetical protein